jgi:competence ComEA-like helix-hairpin-helix protein
MDFAKFLSSIRKKEPAAAAPMTPAPPAPSKPAAQRTPAPAGVDGVESAIRDFAAIQELLKASVETVALPLRVLTKRLPAELRGPAWTEAPPSGTLELERETLVSQLKKGRVVYKLGDLAGTIPEGWIASDPDALVELSLPDVVEALPEDFFRVDAQVSDELIEVAGMRDYFGPRATAPAETEPPPAAAPAPAPAPAQPTRVSAAPTRPERKKQRVLATPVEGLWDGVERTPDAGAATLDANTMAVEDMLRIKGVGRTRAELILQFREAHGRFHSVYDIADIRGVGRRMFTLLTGLNAAPTKRRDRHDVLNALLDLPAGARPALADIMNAMAVSLGARGAVLAAGDGVALARSQGLGEEADRYAAVAPMFMRRAQRHLKKLCGTPVQAVALPTALPPLLVATAPTFVLVLAMTPEVAMDDVVHRALMITTELEWLLGPRLIVNAGES